MLNKDKNSKDNKPFQEMYVVYNRKSTDDADNQKNSLEYQRKANIAHAKRGKLPLALNLTIPGFCEKGIIDEKHSGYKEDDNLIINPDGTVQYKIQRAKFLKMAEMLLNKELKGAIILCWDRASRNKQDDLIIKKLMEQGCDIRFSEATYEKTSSGALHMDIDGMFAAHYSRNISEKVRNSNIKLRDEGRCLYTSPIGYLDKGSDHKPLDPEKSKIVKRVFELYSTGEWSFAQLAKWARGQGLTTKPRRKNRTVEERLANVESKTIPIMSHPVDGKSIENILKNPFYIGKIKVPGGYADSTAHQPLIDVGLFLKVQNMLKARCVSFHYIDKDFFTYRTSLRCKCGRAYSPYVQKGITYYRSRCKAGCENPNPNLLETEVHEIIAQALSSIYFTDEELAQIEEKKNLEWDKISTKRNNELEDLNTQRKNVYEDYDYLIKNKITIVRTGIMKIEEIRNEEIRLGELLAKIDEKVQAYSETTEEMLKYIITFSELVKNASLYYKLALDTEKRDIVTQVFSELVFHNKKLLDYKAKEGFDALLGRHNSSKSVLGSPGRDRTCDQSLNRRLLYR
jgi:site-specific DNA recombinase